jgi:hypothetical protein
VAPAGYKIIAKCSNLDTSENGKALIGKTILHAWDNATGIYAVCACPQDEHAGVFRRACCCNPFVAASLD